MDKTIYRILKEKSFLNENRIKQISDFNMINLDKAIQMSEISEQILENGYDINPNIFENLKLKDLRVLNKSLQEFFNVGKTVVDEDFIRRIDTSKIKKESSQYSFDMLTKEEKINLLSSIYEKNEDKLINIMKVENPEKKIELLNKFIDEEVFDEENYLKKQNEIKAFNILKELSLLETQKEKQCYLRRIREYENKNKENNKTLYNKQLYDVLNDNKLSMDKQDFLKKAYFKKGINLDEFKKNMGNELYNCSEAQLENYVELWDKYQDNLISRDDFYYGKNVVFKEEISQEAIEETLIPILQENTLSKKEIDECINVSYDKDDEFFKEVSELAITAKENEYSQEDIYTLIQDADDASIEKIKEEINLIKEKENDSLDVEKLDDIKVDDISLVQKYDSHALDKGKTDLETDMELDFYRKK